MALGLITAFAAAILYGVASVLQAVAANRTESGGAIDAGVLVRMVKQWPYLLGLALDGTGFLISLVAMQLLPLFLVESVLASAVGVTAILAVAFMHVTLTRVEKVALVVLIIGLILLALSARPEATHALPNEGKWILISGIVLVLALAGASVTIFGSKSGVGLAAASGLAFSGLGVAARTLVLPNDYIRVIDDPTFYAVLIYGLLGTVLFAVALQRANVTTVTALVFGIQTTVPAVIGVAFLGDEAKPGYAWVAILGFVAAVGSSIALAGQSEPNTEQAGPAEAEVPATR